MGILRKFKLYLCKDIIEEYQTRIDKRDVTIIMASKQVKDLKDKNALLKLENTILTQQVGS